MYAAVRSRVSIFAFRYAFTPATSGSSVRVHRYGSCNSRVSWCAYLYVIFPSDSGVTPKDYWIVLLVLVPIVQ